MTGITEHYPYKVKRWSESQPLFCNEQHSRIGPRAKLVRFMSANLATISDGKKFRWDGQLYATQEEASCVEESYHRDKFEVRMVEQDGKFLLYTRRVVKEVVVAAS